jgi:hypothetical protein
MKGNPMNFKHSLRHAKAALAAAALALVSSQVLAWDGEPGGTVLQFEVTASGNFGFRVWLVGTPLMCNGVVPAGAGWAYVNEADGNYKTYVANLMMAKASGSRVQL